MPSKVVVRFLALSAVFTALIFLHYFGLPPFGVLQWRNGSTKHHVDEDEHSTQYPGYTSVIESNAEGVCGERFGTEYIRAFGRSAAVYCKDGHGSTLTCFSHKAHDTRLDTFCHGGPAVANSTNKLLALECAAQDLPAGLPRLEYLAPHWYQTGPRAIFNEDLDLVEVGKLQHSLSSQHGKSKKTLILIKREGPEPVTNLWHTLMQAMSAMLSLDVLRSTGDTITGMPYMSEIDQANSQVVIADTYDDGPFYDLWNSFTGIPVIRASALDLQSATANIVVPLPGGSNPFWQGDWNELACRDSALMKTFSRRILKHYDLLNQHDALKAGGPLTLTYINRTGVRPLFNQDELIPALRAAHPTINIETYDFAAIPFVKQLTIVQNTDILLGVHGAGLTHGMFMRPGSSVVEIMPPNLQHKGFHAMCNFLGLDYFTERAQDYDFPGKLNDWQKDGVLISKDVFLPFMEKVIKSSMKHN